MSDPMAAQLAQLLTQSDEEELTEVVRRWVEEAPTQALRAHYTQFGAKLLELKRRLAQEPVQPKAQDLEVALSMMLKLAAQRKP
jgi:hypothetical protein